MWGDRELEEKNVYDHGKESLYDHGKENGGVNGGGGMYQVEVPSMEQMESDDAVAVAIAAAAAGGQPIYSGLHELTAGAASNSASGASGTSGSSSMHQIDYRTGAEGVSLFVQKVEYRNFVFSSKKTLDILQFTTLFTILLLSV